MALTAALDRYFDAWNAHDPDGVVAALTDGGTYEDPTTGGPIGGDALAANVAGLVAGFPDLSFEVVAVAPTSDTSAAAEWRMRGTNTGASPMGPATGGTVDLPGADFLAYDPGADRISKVVGSFSVTWIEIEPEHSGTLNEATTSIVMEQLENPEYLGTCFATVGKRNFTFSAWESVDAARSALRGSAHAEAMGLMHQGRLGEDAHGLTSIWRAEKLNNFIIPAQKVSRDLAELEGQWL